MAQAMNKLMLHKHENPFMYSEGSSWTQSALSMKSAEVSTQAVIMTLALVYTSLENNIKLLSDYNDS